MTAILVTCRTCGAEFEPDRQSILRGVWRDCPDCRTSPDPSPNEAAGVAMDLAEGECAERIFRPSTSTRATPARG